MADLSVESILSGTVNSDIAGELGPIGPVTIAGIPDHYTFTIDDLPKIQFGVDPLESKLTLEPVTLKIAPIESSISIKEIPSVRTHLPANYALALSFFGVEVAAVHLCGEGQIITEPYEPNPCEVCGTTGRTAAQLASVGDDG